MTGMEELKKEMAARGLTKAQIESKAVYVVLDIVSVDPGKYVTVYEDEQRAKKTLEAANRERMSIERLIIDNRKLVNEAARTREEIKSYVDEFSKALENCDTDEGRDKLRLAQMYVNTVKVNTVYDNTAFIVGLASLLTGTQTDPLKELKKINPKLPLDSDLPIDTLELSVRAYNVLKRAGVNTISDLRETSYERLMKMRNMGPNALNEILTKAKSIGITIESRQGDDET